MQNDKTTLNDLSIFTATGNEMEDVFSLIDYTATQAGKDSLRKHIQYPPDTFLKLKETQAAIYFLAQNLHLFPKNILNGTLVMLEKYFETSEVAAPPPTGIALLLSTLFQKMLNPKDYAVQQFSLSHLADFFTGCRQLADIADMPDVPVLLKKHCIATKEELEHSLTEPIINITKNTKYTELVQLNYRVRRELKGMVKRLITHYALLDAWYAMAKATDAHQWQFPQLVEEGALCFETEGLSHPLLKNPVSYNLKLDKHRNFLILTGANMAGKTTFMRALGVGALLAHLGIGVPAKQMKISYLHGIITNMHVQDNILKGESYFLAEVLRMKQTAQKMQHPTPNLVLMDELFKGTNVHDAYECTKAVIAGLLHQPNHLIILSTHLYEVARQFETMKQIQFAYFVTNIQEDDNFNFTYQLKSGISNDRIGYRILQKEGIIELLMREGG